MLETKCLKCWKINYRNSLIKPIKCGNFDSKHNSDVNLVFIRYFLFSVIYFVSYESEICFELWIILKNGKVGFVSKTRQCFKLRICSKMESLTFLENGQEI